MRPAASLVAWVLLAMTAGPARAQDAGHARPEEAAVELPAAERPEVSVKLSPQEGVVTGDALMLTVDVTAEAGDEVAVPEQSFAPFEVRSRNAGQEDAGHGKRRFRFEIELLAFEPGDHRIGPVELQVMTADGLMGTVATRALDVHVGSLIANEPDAEPKPPTEPVPVMEDDYTLLWILGALGAMALVALLTLLASRWWRRRKAAAAPPAPPRPAHEEALTALHALRRDRPAAEAEGRLGGWVDGVSDALRRYLGRRYGFDGLESTTDEVMDHLRRVALPEQVSTEVSAVLGEADLVKFAKVSPEPQRCDALLEGAYRIVHRTRPAEPAATSQEAAE